MKYTLILILSVFLFAGCTKTEQKKGSGETSQNNTQTDPGNKGPMTNPHTTGDKTQDNTDAAPENATDQAADKLSKEAFDFEATYKKDNSEKNKLSLIEKHLNAGNYLMFKANLNPKKKYAPALKHYRRVLELDPKNIEAAQNKKQIEDIYEMMGRPIPS